MTALELKKWAEDHCQSSKVDHIVNIIVADRYINTYYFSWGGFDYCLDIQWCCIEIENIYFIKRCDGKIVYSLRLELEDIEIVNDRIFISALPRQYYSGNITKKIGEMKCQ
jgi:hypothetical protein